MNALRPTAADLAHAQARTDWRAKATMLAVEWGEAIPYERLAPALPGAIAVRLGCSIAQSVWPRRWLS